MKRILIFIKDKALLLVLAAIIIVGAGTTLAFAAAGNQQSASTPPAVLPTPTPVTSFTPVDEGNCTSCRLNALLEKYRENAAGKSAAEVAALRQELYRQIEQEGLGKVIDCNSPEAWGAEIQIAGKTIKLPADARIRGMMYTGTPFFVNGKCVSGCDSSELPIAWLERGNSTIYLGKTGKVVGGNIDPSELGAFDFLKGTFPEQSEAIDLLPVKTIDKNPQLITVDIDEVTK